MLLYTAVNKVAFYTLGCKLNLSETSTIACSFEQEGFESVEFEEIAHVYAINTCSVTGNEDKRFKYIVKKVPKLNDKAVIIALGCSAQFQPEELAAVNGVDLVLGATKKVKITGYINQISKEDPTVTHSCDIDDANFYVGSYFIRDRTRACLKGQDGCDCKCTYCTIPLARGISRSDALEIVLQNAFDISGHGIKEVALTNADIRDYGTGKFSKKRHEHTFLDLVKAVDDVHGIERLRISSIKPNLLKNETLYGASTSSSFVPHFHIPLQSGNTELLGKIKRRYKRELCITPLDRIKKSMPDARVGVDVIAGFSEKTYGYFSNTYTFLKDLDHSSLPVFTYSERDHTLAASMKSIILLSERKKRSKLLCGLSAKKRRSFYKSQLEYTKKVHWECENKEGFLHRFIDNYVKGKTDWDPALVNELDPVFCESTGEDRIVRILTSKT